MKGWDADLCWIDSKIPKKERKSSQAWRNGRRQRQVTKSQISIRETKSGQNIKSGRNLKSEFGARSPIFTTLLSPSQLNVKTGFKAELIFPGQVGTGRAFLSFV